MKLGRYEVVRELGKGAMGIVYLAKDPLIGRLVALKTIRPVAHADDDETKEFQQRFIREAQAAGILNHPAIVTVHDIGQDESTGVSFIAMEYVEGNNLKELLAQGRPLTWEQIAEIIAQVADALDFAHSKGIVHRDVKPANIILIEGNRAKITDFGIAKIASGTGNLTTTGQFLGTPNYMAPEQIKGTPVDGRTDIFSLGICLYECLTRRKPFGGDSLTSISYKIVHEPFPPLHEINPQIPDGFEDVVGQALSKEPAKRYQRGREMATALRAVIRGERPARIEPMMAEETVITRDKLPTMEMPFPEAATGTETTEGTGEPAAARPRGSVAPPYPIPAAAAAGAASAAQAIPRARAGSASLLPHQLRRTLDGVRAMPAWRRLIPLPIAGAIVGLLVIALLGTIFAIRAQFVSIPAVDAQAEARRARERKLRLEGNDLLRQGRVVDAQRKYEELSRLAPNSPAIMGILQQISSMRQREEVSRQQIFLAEKKRDEGLALLSQRKFPEAVQALQEAYSLNPGDAQVVSSLATARLELERANLARAAAQRDARERAQTARTSTAPSSSTADGTTTSSTAGAAPTASTAPAQLVTFFAHPFTDGHILVKAGADTVLHLNLWEEQRRIIRRRVPRVINVTREITPKNADLEVWVTVPNQRIVDYKRIPANFPPGSVKRLQVTYNAASKTFQYQFQ